MRDSISRKPCPRTVLVSVTSPFFNPVPVVSPGRSSSEGRHSGRLGCWYRGVHRGPYGQHWRHRAWAVEQEDCEPGHVTWKKEGEDFTYTYYLFVLFFLCSMCFFFCFGLCLCLSVSICHCLV